MRPEKDGDADPVAEIRDLRVEIDGRAVVDGVSLRVLPGRVTALVGASGSGKTTTGLALLGEYPAGARVTGGVHVRAGGLVGYVPQHPAAALNPARRVPALLTDIARAQVRQVPLRQRRAAARERVLRALSEAQLPDGEALLRRFPHQLSGGQQQRVVLAQALLLGARVVVADEPTTGQDALTKRRIVEQLTAVAARGIAVVLLSHDLDVVRALADEVVVMRAGRVVESGPAQQVLLAPRHAWTRELLAAGTQLPYPAETAARAGRPVLRVRGLTARHRDGTRGGTAVVLRAPELDLYAGEILLDGAPLPRSLRDRGRAQLAAVQYVFQDAHASFDEHRPVVRQVARTAVRLRGADPDTATREALTTLAGLGITEDLAGRRPGRLSGGELQRAALARALLARPRVLVCDEITSGLDTLTRRGILDVLTALVRDRDGLSLVLVTHDLDTAALAHRIAVLDAGTIVEQGPARRILTAPAHPFTASHVARAPTAATRDQ